MNLTRCSNGHFYDEDKFDKCPHCGSAELRSGDPTVAMSRDDNVTVALTQASAAETPEPQGTLKEAVQKAIAGAPVAGDDAVTVGYFNKAVGTDPVVGWLVCVEGSHHGEDFRLKTGRNFIGRSSGMDVSIAGDNTVSRDRHAVVVFEPVSHAFLVQPGEARELCYLNDRVVLSAEELKAYDVLTVGSTKLMFIPCCGERFSWNAGQAEQKEEDQ